MFGVQGLVRAAQLEAPDVVAEVDAAEQAGAGEVDQIALDRRGVVAVAGQRLDQLAVAARYLGGLEVLQHRDPGPGAAQASVADDLA